MKIKVFNYNQNGKIEFTPAELEKLLNDTYAEGQRNCNCNNHITWTNPCVTPYITATSNDSASPKTYTTTLNVNSESAEEVSKHINEIIKNVTAKIDNDAFSKLAKELNF